MYLVKPQHQFSSSANYLTQGWQIFQNYVENENLYCLWLQFSAVSGHA